MELLIYYLNEHGIINVLSWKVETKSEALLLADEVCRKGALVPDEGKLIPAHRIMMAKFAGEEEKTQEDAGKATTDSIRGSLERFAFDLRSMSAEPCPVGQKCELLSKLADKLDGILNAPTSNR